MKSVRHSKNYKTLTTFLELQTLEESHDIESIFLNKPDVFKMLYLEACDRYMHQDKKDRSNANFLNMNSTQGDLSEKSFFYPNNQLSMVGLGLLLFYKARTQNELAQPLIATTAEDIEHIAKLISNPKTPIGTQVNVIHHNLENLEIPGNVSMHKTLFRIIKSCEKEYSIIHFDSVKYAIYSFEFFKTFRHFFKEDSGVMINAYVQHSKNEFNLQGDNFHCGTYSRKIARDLDKHFKQLAIIPKQPLAPPDGWTFTELTNPDSLYGILADHLNSISLDAVLFFQKLNKTTKFEPSADMMRGSQSRTTIATLTSSNTKYAEVFGITAAKHPRISYIDWFAYKDEMMVKAILKGLTFDEMVEQSNAYFAHNWTLDNFINTYGPKDSPALLRSNHIDNFQLLLQSLVDHINLDGNYSVYQLKIRDFSLAYLMKFVSPETKIDKRLNLGDSDMKFIIEFIRSYLKLVDEPKFDREIFFDQLLTCLSENPRDAIEGSCISTLNMRLQELDEYNRRKPLIIKFSLKRGASDKEECKEVSDDFSLAEIKPLIKDHVVPYVGEGDIDDDIKPMKRRGKRFRVS